MLKERFTRVWGRLVKKYRLVVYDQESLSQARNVIFKPLSLLAIGASVFVVIAGITSLLIFKVPAIHNHIPGFQSHLSEDYKSLQRKNNEMEREVAEMDSMLKVFTAVMGAGTKPLANGKVWETAMPEPATVTPADSETENFGQHEQEVGANGQSKPDLPISNVAGISPTKPQNGLFLNLVSPIDGYVTKDFEPKDKPHFGIDLAAEENSLVRSVAEGVIIFSEYSNTTGYVVGIWHSKYNLISFYKHNSRLFKTVGSYVFAGEAIAVIGNTGINSSGTHLHFELWYNNSPVNPADYITFN